MFPYPTNEHELLEDHGVCHDGMMWNDSLQREKGRGKKHRE